jgi:hypothetical protein
MADHTVDTPRSGAGAVPRERRAPATRSTSPAARGTFAPRAAARGASLPPQRPSAAPPPEWRTDPWKHRVEAEARSRLKKRLRGTSVA